MIRNWEQSFDYCDDEGFEIKRRRKSYFVYGSATGEYSFYYNNEEESEEFEMECLSADCTVDGIMDEEGEEVFMLMSPEEQHAWESYIQVLLDNYARNMTEPRDNC